MDLLKSPPEQIEALIDWMLEQAELKPPGPPEHAERCLQMREHAWFLREIVLPKWQVQGRMASLSLSEGVNGLPQRPDSLKRDGNGFLSKGLPAEEKAPDPAEGVSEPFELPTSIPGAIG